MHPVSFKAPFHEVWVVWVVLGGFTTLRPMDATTQGLASALTVLGINNLADLVEIARSGVLEEMIVTAVEWQNLEQRVNEAVVVQTLVAERRAAQLAQAEERAAEAERRQAEAEAKSAAAEAAGPVRLSIQIHPQTSARSHMVHARTQTPVRFPDQVSVGTQAPSPQDAAAAAKQQQQQRQQLEKRAQERARDAVVPLLARAVASAEAAQRAALQQLEAVRPTAERSAREAASAAADREAAMEQRGQLAAVQSELRSLKIAAALVEEERERAQERVASLEREKVDFEDVQVGLLEMLKEARNRRCRHCSEA